MVEVIKKVEQPKKIQELKGKNTIIINPKLEEGIETLGGYVLGVDELTNEQVANIEELKSTTLSSYINKATADSLQKASSSGVHSAFDGADSKKATQKRDKAWKRAKGISKAGSKLAIRAIEGGQQREEVEEVEEKKGLWDNIHAKRKRGEAPAKKGDKDYPKTLNVEGKMKQARKNVGADSCCCLLYTSDAADE